MSRVRSATEGLTDGERISEKAREKKHRVYVDLEKAYDRVNMEALWQVLRIYDVGMVNVQWN